MTRPARAPQRAGVGAAGRTAHGSHQRSSAVPQFQCCVHSPEHRRPADGVAGPSTPTPQRA